MQKTTPYFIIILLFILSSTGYAQSPWPPNDPHKTSTWNGIVSSNYNNAANWTPPEIPVQQTIIIPRGTPFPLSKNIPIYPSVSIILEAGVSLTMDAVSMGAGNYIWLKSDPNDGHYSKLTLTGTTYESNFGGPLKIEPGSSLVADRIRTERETVTTLESTSKTYASIIINQIDGERGKTIYKRYTNKIGSGTKGGNDLISSPVRGINFNNAFITANPKLSENQANKGEYAFAPYNVTAGAYQNFDIGSPNTGSIALVPGKGYRAATNDGSPLVFKGLSNLEDVNITILNGPADKGNGWNLIGNPYPAYIKFKEFFELNKTQLRNEYQTIYGYNSSENTWTQWNQATIDDKLITELITPGQGFFVKAKPDGGIISFNKNMRTTGNSDDFIVGREEQKDIALSKLKLSNGTQNRLTSIYFIEGTTRALDPGYDSASYSGAGSSEGFSIASNLVEDHKGLGMGIQSLPYSDFNDVVVPLEISASAGTTLTLSIDDLSTLPSNINVYLEDTQSESKVLHLLNANAYTFKTTSNGSQAGRFNVHYSAKTLSVADLDVSNNLRIYTSETPKTLFVIGQLKKESKIQLFDIQGRLVLSKILSPNSTENTMDISMINSGIYVVRVANDHQNKTQKVVIK